MSWSGRAIRALKTSPGAMFRESPEGVRRKEVPNSQAFLITNLICPKLLEVPFIPKTASD